MPRERQRRPDGRPLGDFCLRPGERPFERRPLVTTDHQPVMTEEVLHFLAPRPGGVYVDATLGAGGHAEAILESVGGRCTLVGVDRDAAALARARHNLQSYGGAVKLVESNFADLSWILQSHELAQADGILLDLGMSSMQIDDPQRGFSFRQDGPLDMRMDPSQPLNAADVVNTYSGEDLARVLRRYGQERFARQIVRAIVTARRRRPLRTTKELATLIEESYPSRRRPQHPARRTFQALRMEVNGELASLESALKDAPDVLAPGGRLVVISYHSLEDSLTKRILTEASGGKAQALPGLGSPQGRGPLEVLTRGAVLPSEAEVERNPRASSARLRAAARRRSV
jgi:16S rRNA (cytosine1402-N4)-methyltransferase